MTTDPRQTQYNYDERHVDINYFNKTAKAQEQFYIHQRCKRCKVFARS